MKSAVNDALKATFKPEFLNRLDEIIVFNKLSDVDIEKIARIMLNEVASRINSLGITVEFTDEVISKLAKEGFDPVYGARPLKRFIQQKLETLLARKMIAEDLEPGTEIVIDYDGRGLKA